MLSRRLVFAIVLSAALLAAGALAASGPRDVIERGSDLWRTLPEGSYVEFSENPIPAGFFCSGSEHFSGRIELQGEQLRTEPPEAFGNADTVVERLDDAVFDARGVARTRLQMRALSMVSRQPLQTRCGAFVVTVGLDGDQQPVTEMEIHRDGSIGGYFLATVELYARISFWPLSGDSDFRSAAQQADRLRGRGYRPLQVVQFFRLNSNPSAGWTSFPGSLGVRFEGPVRIDRDGDGEAETAVAGTSNFHVGWWDQGGKPGLRNVYMVGGLDRFATSHYPTHHALQAATYGKSGKDGAKQ